jgi:NAD(P)-dependent dehydrogenase (short-subunit alcohol dehydrogenase family)
VNVTSGLASATLHTDPSWKYYKVKSAAYGPSKTALNAYTIVLAYELKDTAFKINVVDPGYTATDFNHHRGTGTVPDAAARIVKYATIGNDGPTGRFFSDDNNPETGVSPW